MRGICSRFRGPTRCPCFSLLCRAMASTLPVLDGLFKRCFGLYHSKQESRCIETTRSFCLSCFRSGRFLQHAGNASWSLGVTCYGRSNLNKEEQQALAGGPVETFLSSFLKGPRYARKFCFFSVLPRALPAKCVSPENHNMSIRFFVPSRLV